MVRISLSIYIRMFKLTSFQSFREAIWALRFVVYLLDSSTQLIDTLPLLQIAHAIVHKYGPKHAKAWHTNFAPSVLC